MIVDSPTDVGGIVLCGGKSSRMGIAKSTLPFGPELMLERVVRLLGAIVQPIVVVAAPNQDLSAIHGDYIVAHDRREHQGPLEGIAVGLSAITPHARVAYITGCDVPLLQADFVRRVVQLLGDHDIAVPRDGQFFHPLAAVYRTSILSQVESLLAEDKRRPMFLFDCVNTKSVDVNELDACDPERLSLRNLNRAEDYIEALRRAGFSSHEAESLFESSGPRDND